MNVLRLGDGQPGPRTRGYAAKVTYAALLCKEGGTPTECEDRIAWQFRDDRLELRVAIADGASASLLAGEWAELLATAFCGASAEPDFGGDTMADLSATWRRLASGATLPWYAQAKAAQGAFATILGVTVQLSGTWTAVAAGDSCQFLVREGKLVQSFPIDRADDFGRTPLLLNTNGEESAPILMRRSGTWESGDHLYLMTDALSAWALTEIAQGRDPWTWLRALESSENAPAFASWVADMRASGRLENDDVALVHVRLGTKAA